MIREYVDDEGYVIASWTFASFYMTSLANRICQRLDSKALLTNLTYTNDLTNQLLKRSPNQRMGEELMEQGLMYKYIINGLGVSPDTPVDRILEFRTKYKDERDLFKYEISNLIQNTNMEGLPASEVVNQISRLYRMKVLPSLNQLERALNGIGLETAKQAGADILITGITALEPTGAGLATFGWKAIKDIGVSIWKKVVSYNKDKEKELRNSQYSYLHRVKKFHG